MVARSSSRIDVVEERGGHLHAPAPEGGLGGPHEAGAPDLTKGRQCRRLGQHAGAGEEAAACAREVGDPLQPVGDLGVGADGRLRGVPGLELDESQLGRRPATARGGRYAGRARGGVVDGRPHQRMPELDRHAQRHQTGELGGLADDVEDAESLRRRTGSGRGCRWTRPLRRAATSGRQGQVLEPAAGRSPRGCARQGSVRSARLDSVSRRASSSAASSSSASGLPPVAAAIRARGGRAPSVPAGRTGEAPRHRRSGSPGTCRTATPAARSVRRGSSRPAINRTADSASSRRATKNSACSDSASRWWASSTEQDQRHPPRSLRRPARAPPIPMRKRSGGCPWSSPGRDAQRLLVAVGQRREVHTQRQHEPVERGEGDRRLGLVAGHVQPTRPRGSAAAPSSAVFPMPGSPSSSSEPPRPLRAAMSSAATWRCSTSRPVSRAPPPMTRTLAARHPPRRRNVVSRVGG